VAIPLLDRSNYYKGLLLLIRKDQIVDPREREMLMELGRALDFDPRFCEAAIEDLLINPHLPAKPPVFSTRQTAECFLLDAIRLAAVDGHIHRSESNWLKNVARANGMTNAWVETEIRNLRRPGHPTPFCIEQHLR
jgi:hypothetical protein